MLNAYQTLFISRLTEAGVIFIVVGGQAKHGFNGDYDLDLWIDGAEANLQAAYPVLASWYRENPMHLDPCKIDELHRNGLRDRLQITIPDADALYLGADGDAVEIGPDKGIEMLFRAQTHEGRSFAEYAARARQVRAAERLMVPCLAPDDIPTLPRLFKHRSPHP